MKGKKRRYVWLGLLLASSLSIQGGAAVWAGGETDIIGDEVEIGAEMDQEDESPGQEGETPTGLSENETDGESAGLSENGADAKPSHSGNSLSADEKHLTVSDNQDLEKEILDRPLNVVLPTEIPFSMVLFGEEGLEGWIKSDQFCIENRGYEDVRISIHGVCSGEKEEDYVISDSSVENEYVQGKKNVWVYLRWEDENREVLDRPEIVMGDASNPGEGELVLKAPKRDGDGKIISTDCDSKAYFTFRGDLKSDMDELWRSDELKLELNLNMEPISSVDMGMEGTMDPAGNRDILAQPDVPDTAADESEPDDGGVSDMRESLSDNADVHHAAEESVSDNEDVRFRISENSMGLRSAD